MIGKKQECTEYAPIINCIILGCSFMLDFSILSDDDHPAPIRLVALHRPMMMTF